MHSTYRHVTGPARARHGRFAPAAILSLFLSLLAVAASANTLSVPSEYPTIASAVLQANGDGASGVYDTINIAPGTYYESNIQINEPMVLIGLSASNTIIDGSQGNGTPILIIYGIDNQTLSFSATTRPEPTIQNLTFQHGFDQSGQAQGETDGGAIRINSSSPIIAYCNFDSNKSVGGIGAQGGYTVTNGPGASGNGYGYLLYNPYSQNSGGTSTTYSYGGPGGNGIGGAIYAGSSSPTIEYCDFNGNRTIGGLGGPGAPGGGGAGGAVAFNGASFAYLAGLPSVTHCTFESNQAAGGAANNMYSITVNQNPNSVLNLSGGGAVGGSISDDQAQLAISNCFFTSSSATNGETYGGYGSGNCAGGAVFQGAAAVTYENCLFNNDSVSSQEGANGGAIGTMTIQSGSTQMYSTVDLYFCTIANSHTSGSAFGANGIGVSMNFTYTGNATAADNASGTFNAENDIIYDTDSLQSYQVNGLATQKYDIDLNNANGSLTYSDITQPTEIEANFTPSNCISTDPKFQNSSAGNLMLSSQSPCVYAGVHDSSLPSTDIVGYQRNYTPSMGAYEYQHTLTVSGVSSPPAGVAGTPYTGTLFQLVDSSASASAASLSGSALSIAWGDGTTSQGTAALSSVDNAGAHFNVSGSHSYAVGGTYNVVLTVSSSVTSGYASVTGNPATTQLQIQNSANVSITSSVNPVAIGSPVTFTATVSNDLLPSGTVTFYYGGSVLGTSNMGVETNQGGIEVNNPNEAQYTWTPEVNPGSALITAVYSGDANVGQGSASLTEDIQSPTSLMASSAGNAPPGQNSEVVATLTFNSAYTAYGDPNPSGTVSVYDGNTFVGQGTLFLSSQSQMMSIIVGPYPTAGSRTITVKYSGDELYAPSQTSFTTTVPASSYTVTPSAGPGGSISPNTAQTVTAGGSQMFTATPSSGYIVGIWSVDGTTVQTGGTTYTISNVTANHTVSVSFTQVATDVSGQIKVTLGGLARTPGSTNFGQQVTLTNTGGSVITGPISLVLNGLTSGVTLTNASGTTLTTSPAGSPYVTTSSNLAAGASVSLVLKFANPSLKTVNYQTRILAGPGAR